MYVVKTRRTIVFPLYERVDDVHVLTIADGAVNGSAVVVKALRCPYLMGFPAEYVHTVVFGISGNLMHLIVGFVEREVAVHFSVDEVYFNVVIGSRVFAVFIGDVA